MRVVLLLDGAPFGVAGEGAGEGVWEGLGDWGFRRGGRGSGIEAGEELTCGFVGGGHC